MSKKLIVLLAGVMAVAIFAAGCGSSDDSTTAELSQAEFLKQGNAICTAGNKEIEAGFSDLSFDKNKGPSDAEIEEFAEGTLAPSVTKQVEEIRELGVPSDDEDAVNAFLDGADEAVEEVEEDPTSIAGNEDPFAEVQKEARAVGLTACAEE